MAERLSWGILGTGNIARKFSMGVQRSRTGHLAAVGSRTMETAKAFAEPFKIPHAHGSYEAVLADPTVEAVYISTPHPMHAQWAIAAAAAGKHVLCEKPIAMNYPEAQAIVEAAREHDVFLMEAFMYRLHPQTAKVIELLRQKVVGEVRLIKASFGFHNNLPPTHRIVANELGGGGILDVGCYPVSFSRLIAGVAMGKDFADPVEVKACGHLGSTGVDEWTVCVMKFPGGILASLSTSISLDQDNFVQILCSEGSITIPWPWIPAREGGTEKILVHKSGQDVQEIAIHTSDWLYSMEADAVAEGIERRQAAFPGMTPDDSLGNMKALDQWRAEIGLVYECEQPQAVKVVHGGPLKVDAAAMKYGRIAALDKPISRLIMGAAPNDMPRTAVLFDDFFEHGGNCFDTAHMYGDGLCETLLGQWVRNRGVRSQVVILDKGANAPWCTPEYLSSQHAESLDRLQMDFVDIYMIHRDNPAVPVGEFIDAMNRHLAAGTMKCFGVSNWTIERIEQANAYATKNHLASIAAVSNNFSLAILDASVWPGCLHSSDAASRQWFAGSQMPLMAWTSQAKGFFSDRAGPDKLDDKERVRCWYSPDNFLRRQRAYELAKKKGIEPNSVALAYVLCQPFPTFAMIGPRTLANLRSSLEALTVELTDGEVRFLRGE